MTSYKYKHTYRCILENKRHRSSILYDMHCDYANPRDKKNIKELRKRLREVKLEVRKGGKSRL